MKYALQKQTIVSILDTIFKKKREREVERELNLLGKFISRPANSRAGHCCDNPGPDSLEEAPEALPSIQQLAAIQEAADVPDLRIRGCASCL